MLKKVSCALVLAGVMASGIAAAATEDSAEVEQEKILQSVTIVFEEKDKDYTSEEGELLLTTRFSKPNLTKDYSEAVREAFNQYYEKEFEAFHKTSEAYLSQAKENYKEQMAHWMCYGLDVSYSVQRRDAQIISMEKYTYSDLGGPHPNNCYEAQNFNAMTGQMLTFQDIVTDEVKARKAVNDYIIKEIDKKANEKSQEEFSWGMFDKSHVKDILKDNTWYLSDNGLEVICNTDIIAPYAAGMMTFSISYDQFPYLKKEYQNNK